MTKEKFIRIQKQRGYEVEEMGKTVTLRMDDEESEYTAIWFFNENGSIDENHKPVWSLKKHNR